MLNLSHKKLDVYIIAMKLVKEVYRITKGFPAEERYVLTSQLRRAAITVCSNIEKDHQGKQNRKKEDFLKFRGVQR